MGKTNNQKNNNKITNNSEYDSNIYFEDLLAIVILANLHISKKTYYDNTNYNSNIKTEFKNKVRTGGAKGKEGSSDYTKGKKAFARPCTVGWKPQKQPLMKGGGNKTPL